MQKTLAPAFVKQIQDALSQGQVVIIPAPAGAEAPATAPPRDKDALTVTLCLIFRLRRSEGQILAELITHDSRTREQLHRAAIRGGPTITLGTTGTLISTLRKKLASHGIEVTNVSRLGYGLRTASREKICRWLDEHAARIIATTAPAASTPSKVV
jgi:hypothetical protein